MTGSLLAPDQVGALENALNETLTAGRLLDAYATFYDEDALRGGVRDPQGVDRECARVLRFFHWAERFHGLIPARSTADGHTTRSEWVRAARAGASRARPARRIVTRYWRQGRVVHERIENAPPLANRSPRPQRATEE